ncbi:NUDIX domain-containing protein [Xylaria cf. heliscus]|nr:NUDIX domain-containing protein [Xylaria cf. heliscus]
MAERRWKSTLYPADLFVESCGAIVFDRAAAADRKVCVLNLTTRGGEWVLPKGRRNCHETRQEAARREVREESGYGVALLPLTLPTRAPSAAEPPDVGDVARVYDAVVEPFMLDVRDLAGKGVKLVWWFVAQLDPAALDAKGEGEEKFRAVWLRPADALLRLTFQKDRDVLSRAVQLVQGEREVVTNGTNGTAG